MGATVGVQLLCFPFSLFDAILGLLPLQLLLLQGIPADDLLLTKEAEEQLKDLAGNAMSTTVVGACMLSALVLGCDSLNPRPRLENNQSDAAVVSSLVPRPLAPATNEVRIVKDMGNYESTQLCLAPVVEQFASEDASDFFSEADSSAQKCSSEGYDKTIPTSSILSCKECGQSSSLEFATPPRKFEEHVFVSMKDGTRSQPAAFRQKLLDLLPMRFELHGFNADSLNMPNGTEKKLWESWKTALSAATLSNCDENGSPAEFRFFQVTRSHIWTVLYKGTNGSKLELRISRTGALWLLFAKAPAERGSLRDALERPIARMCIRNLKDSGLLCGTWEICLPIVSPIDLSIVGAGSKVDSWSTKLGLKGGFEEEYYRYEKLEIGLMSNGHNELEKLVCGVYKLLPKCGGACGSLHKRVQVTPGAGDIIDDMYLFLESGRCTVGSEDMYVFSSYPARTGFGEYREVVLKVDPKYRPVFSKDSEADSKDKLVRAFIPGQWVSTHASIKLISNSNDDSTDQKVSRVTSPSTSLLVSMSYDGWNRCPEVLSCDIPMSNGDKLYQLCSRGLPTNNTGSAIMEVNLRKSKFLFKSLAFVTSRLTIPNVLSQAWLPLESTLDQRIHGEPCQKCAPAKPRVKWSVITKGGRQQYVPIEDGKQASVYEQALKKRPSPWKVHLCAEPGKVSTECSSRTLQLRIGCNAASLAHRALAMFPQSLAREFGKAARESMSFDWRIVPHVEKQSGSFPKLRFTSNKETPPAEQPPRFQKYDLRPEQLRSLSWMLAQEASEEPFMEEEVTESILPNMNWRAEGRVRRPVFVRGGIIADEVGYGKTAITLGLIDAAPSVNGAPPDPPKHISNGWMRTHATLVIVPSHLMGQWPKEIDKFLGEAHKRVLVIKDMTGFNKLTSEKVQSADIVVVNFTVLSNDTYFSRLARLAGVNHNSLPRCGKTGGKHFNAVYNECLTGLAKRVSMMKEDCSRVFDSIENDAFLHATKELEAKSAIRLDGKKAVYKKISEEQTKVEGSAVAKDSLSPRKDVGNREAVRSKLRKDDPWELSFPNVQHDVGRMKCPPLEMFFWDRIVVGMSKDRATSSNVEIQPPQTCRENSDMIPFSCFATDEFHYLEEKKDRARVLALVVLGLKASFRWCLSGTPPHENFTDVQSLAKLLGIHLGVNEGLPNKKLAKRSEESGLDKFTELLEMRSIQWHERRHKQAQLFLDRFLRQNIAEIDEIKCEEHLIQIDLPPAEKAIYLELETHLKVLLALFPISP